MTSTNRATGASTRARERPRRPSHFLVVSQVYVPDPASVGQHLADLCAGLVADGHKVTVLTADRGYDEPERRYSRRENIDGVEVRRLRWTSFGKRTLMRRLLGGAVFVIQASWLGLLKRGVAGVIVATSPPLSIASAWLISAARRLPLTVWVVDLNPEQAVAAGIVSPDSLGTRVLDRVYRLALGRAHLVVALDEPMAERLRAKNVRDPLVIAPWAHNGEATPGAGKAYLEGLGIADRFVFMYSGNHSLVHPLEPLLSAVEQIRDRTDVSVLFIGGGRAKPAVDAAIAGNRLQNAISLPYEPLGAIEASLAAADVHIVVMGDKMSGIVHPCKLYGALAAARPVLIIGPHPAGDVVVEQGAGWMVENDAEAIAVALERTADTSVDSMLAMRQAARNLSPRFARSRLRAELAEKVAETVYPDP